jgi:hypothetical protein
MATDLANDVKTNAKGLFALCTQPAEQRKVEFFINPGLFDGYGESLKQQKEVENVKKLYDEANKKFQEISGLPQLTELNYEIYTARTLKPLIDKLVQLASSKSLNKLSKFGCGKALDNIKNGKFEEVLQLMQRSRQPNITTMNMSLYDLYQKGLITKEIALEYSLEKGEMDQRIRGMYQESIIDETIL